MQKISAYSKCFRYGNIALAHHSSAKQTEFCVFLASFFTSRFHPMTTRKYTAVLFDLDGTLRASLPEGFEAFVEFAGRVGLSLNNEQVATVEREAHRYWGGRQVDKDMIRYDQRKFWINYNQLLLSKIGAADCADCAERINDLFDEYEPVDVIFADSRIVLKALRERGFIIGLVSNREGDLWPLMESYGLDQYFHFTLAGGEIKSYKPDERIFLKALEMASQAHGATLTVRDALYVGDNYFADVEGSRGVGMDSVLIDHRNVFAGFEAVRVKRLRDVLNCV
jgi:HAD superfamily hydrolase (TIGR01549 family)